MLQDDGRTASVHIELEPGEAELPLALGVEISGGRTMTIVEAGTPLPITYSRVFSTEGSYQMAAEFHIMLGDRPLAKDCLSLCRIRIRDLRWSSAGVPKIELAISMDRTGMLSISVANLDRKHTEVKTTMAMSSISHKNLQEALEDALLNTEKDTETRNAIADMLEGYQFRDDVYERYSVVKRKMGYSERRSYKTARNRLDKALAIMPPEADARSIEELCASLAQMREIDKLLHAKKPAGMNWR